MNLVRFNADGNYLPICDCKCYFTHLNALSRFLQNSVLHSLILQSAQHELVAIVYWRLRVMVRETRLEMWSHRKDQPIAPHPLA